MTSALIDATTSTVEQSDAMLILCLLWLVANLYLAWCLLKLICSLFRAYVLRRFVNRLTKVYRNS
jgi:predicted PurR-regulated permease PerM